MVRDDASSRSLIVPADFGDSKFFPSPGPPSFDVNSLGGSMLVRLERSIISARWRQQEAARSLGLRKIRSYSVVDATNRTHHGSVEAISHLVGCSDLGIYVPPGRYRLIDYMGGIFFGKGDPVMSAIRFGIDKTTGSRFFESRDGEYLQWIPRDENTATLIWTMGHVPISTLIQLVSRDYKGFSGRLSGMVEYSGGKVVPLSSSEDAIARTKAGGTPLRSLMVGFDDILVKWLSADQVSADAPIDGEFSQISIICHREDCERLAERWIAETASPHLGRNASQIAQRLGSGGAVKNK